MPCLRRFAGSEVIVMDIGQPPPTPIPQLLLMEPAGRPSLSGPDQWVLLWESVWILCRERAGKEPKWGQSLNQWKRNKNFDICSQVVVFFCTYCGFWCVSTASPSKFFFAYEYIQSSIWSLKVSWFLDHSTGKLQSHWSIPHSTRTITNLPLLLALVPPSHMVAPSRELANIQNFPFPQPTNSVSTNNHTNQHSSPSMEVDKLTHRGQFPDPNHNHQRSWSAESTTSGASSMDYAKRMQAQNYQS